VGRSVNEILTRQTCGQRSSRAAESKHRALGNDFPERIRYMFLISKCRGDRDLGLRTTSVHAFGEPQINGKIQFFLCQNTFFPRKLPLRIGSPHASTKVVHRPRSQSPLHFHIRNIWQIRPEKIISNRLAFAFRSPARALVAGLPRQDHVYITTDESFRFHSQKFDEMRCKLDSAENLRSFKKYPTPF